MIQLVAMLLALAPPPFAPDQTVVDEFSAYTHVMQEADGAEQTYHYRLHAPRRVSPGETYPLVLWFHGARERGDDNLEQLRWMELALQAAPPEDRDYFLLAVQCHEDQESWTSANRPEGGGDPIAVALDVLDETIACNPVDANRICIAGVSGGGNACWETLSRAADRFAGAAPMAAGPGKQEQIPAIAKVPVWAFYSLRDNPPSDSLVRYVDEVKKAGGSAHVTVVDNAEHNIESVLGEHDCWTAAFQYYGVMQWMLSQEQGAILRRPPGMRQLPWWNWAALGLGLVGCGVVWKVERRRRARERKATLSMPVIQAIKEDR